MLAQTLDEFKASLFRYEINLQFELCHYLPKLPSL